MFFLGTRRDDWKAQSHPGSSCPCWPDRGSEGRAGNKMGERSAHQPCVWPSSLQRWPSDIRKLAVVISVRIKRVSHFQSSWCF